MQTIIWSTIKNHCNKQTNTFLYNYLYPFFSFPPPPDAGLSLERITRSPPAFFSLFPSLPPVPTFSCPAVSSPLVFDCHST